MKITIVSLTLVLTLTLPALAKTDPRPAPETAERPIDLMICLDTSGSMSGLIEAAKQKLWDIVNELGRAKPKPHLRVGLYVYGTPSYGTETGYVRKLIDLTDDLDAVYGKLTPLQTDGGDEYVARVVRASLREQPWTKGNDCLKIIVVAGNEPATQDPQFDSLAIAKEAITAGIIVNTIFCGPLANQEAAGWRAVAQAADGQFASIDHDHGTVVVATPFDQKLAELSGAINGTYVGYGQQAELGGFRQAAADRASVVAGPAVAASRAVAKSGGQYRNAGWDLVDARAQNRDFELAKVKATDLPAEMQPMTLAEREAYLTKKTQERAEIQQEITELNRKRQEFIAAELKTGGKNTDRAFDAAMLKAIRAQAAARQFRFE